MIYARVGSSVYITVLGEDGIVLKIYFFEVSGRRDIARYSLHKDSPYYSIYQEIQI